MRSAGPQRSESTHTSERGGRLGAVVMINIVARVSVCRCAPGITLVGVRRLLTPRWLALHLAAVVLAGACLALGWWQWQRSQDGNPRSFAYALQWPAFAAFVLLMWGRMIYDELRPAVRPPEASAETTPDAAPDPAPVAAHLEVAPPAELDPAEEELAAYNRYLAELHARSQRYGR